MRGRWSPAGLLGAALALLPQGAAAAEGLNLFPRPDLVLTNLVVVLLLIWPVNRLLISPLVRILQEREARTQGASEAASALRAQASEERATLEAQRAQARRAAAERRHAILAEAKQEEQRLIDAARAAAAQSLAEVRTSVAAEVEQARSALRTDAQALAKLAAERILARPL